MAALSTICMGEAAPEPAGPGDGAAPSAAFLNILASLQGGLGVTNYSQSDNLPIQTSGGAAVASNAPAAPPVPLPVASPVVPPVDGRAPAADVRPANAANPATPAVPATPHQAARSAVPASPSPVTLAHLTKPEAAPAPEVVPEPASTSLEIPAFDAARPAERPIGDAEPPAADVAAAPAVELPAVAVAAPPAPRAIERRSERAPAVDAIARHEVALPTHAAAPAEAAVEVAPAALPRTLEAAVAAQLVERIASIRSDEDGDHELTVQLDPADLGHLDLRVRFERGIVHVHVDARSTGTADLLRDAMPELRAALLDAGLAAGSFDVSNGQPHASQHRADGQATSAAHHRTDHPVPAIRRPVHRLDARGVDVLL